MTLLSKRVQVLPADWPAPACVRAGTTLRTGGVSEKPWDSLNLALHVGDSIGDVDQNRLGFQQTLGGEIHLQWLQQVHGNTVHLCESVAEPAMADAIYTLKRGLACIVMTADCLPLLLCDVHGRCVAAVHVGWRGLVADIIENAVVEVLGATHASPAELIAWLGPCIGPEVYEVGEEVRSACLEPDKSTPARIDQIGASFSESRPGHYFADLPALAGERLQALGVSRTYGGRHCTLTQPEKFFSYRRDGETGRMASFIYLL